MGGEAFYADERECEWGGEGERRRRRGERGERGRERRRGWRPTKRPDARGNQGERRRNGRRSGEKEGAERERKPSNVYAGDAVSAQLPAPLLTSHFPRTFRVLFKRHLGADRNSTCTEAKPKGGER